MSIPTYWSNSTQYNNAPAGTFTLPETHDQDILNNAITDAETALTAQGNNYIIAPMHRNTWYAYRCITHTDNSPSFFLEPSLPSTVGTALEAHGYTPISTYISARAILPNTPFPRPKINNIHIEQIPHTHIPSLFPLLYQQATSGFETKMFYASITYEEFAALYQGALNILGDRAVLLVARDSHNTPVGFLFGYDDPCTARGTRMVFKTFAAAKAGAGAMLAWHFHEQARSAGYHEVIHALMHSDNISQKTSERFGGVVFRTYAVYGKHA